jgi:tight adherence protein B
VTYAFPIFLVLTFVAGVLLLEGLYLLWNEQRGPEAKRLESRLRNLSAGGSSEEVDKLIKRSLGGNLNPLDRFILGLPRLHGLDRFLEQSGSSLTVSTYAMLCLGLGGVSFVALATMTNAPVWFLFAIAVMVALLPYLFLSSSRNKRLRALERDLPEAIDLISRGMQAGHGFSAALQMVGDELVGPVAHEFRILSEELNFGVAADMAFMNLAHRVPSDDVRFFVIAVLLQRETGGNLVEVLKNISHLIRDRLALYGKVNVLAAEGKLSAYILTALPIGTGAMMTAVNPKLMEVLWTDPKGIKLVYICSLMMIVGIYWMFRLVKIRV